MADERITIIHWATIEHPGEDRPIAIQTANLFREFADWLESVGPLAIGAEGDIGLTSGSVKWRRLP